MDQRIGLIPFWKGYDRALYVKAAVLAERLGYHSFWVPEAWGYDAFSLLTEIAVKTKRIELGTGIINVFSRSPALIAMQTATLDHISNGRFNLGLGTSGARVIDGFHGREFKAPLTHVRDVIRATRTLLAGQPLSEAGMKLHHYRPFTLEMKPVRTHVPIYVAALKENAITSIGEMADGWIPIFWPYDRLKDGRAWVDAGAQKAGRPSSAITTAPFTTVIPIPGKGATRRAKDIIAFYIGGMGDYYKELLTGFGYGEACETIDRLYKNKETREKAIDAVPDELVEVLTISGDPLYCAREIRRRRQYGVELPIIGLPPGVPWPALAAFLVALAPRNWP